MENNVYTKLVNLQNIASIEVHIENSPRLIVWNKNIYNKDVYFLNIFEQIACLFGYKTKQYTDYVLSYYDDFVSLNKLEHTDIIENGYEVFSKHETLQTGIPIRPTYKPECMYTDIDRYVETQYNITTANSNIVRYTFSKKDIHGRYSYLKPTYFIYHKHNVVIRFNDSTETKNYFDTIQELKTFLTKYTMVGTFRVIQNNKLTTTTINEYIENTL